MLVYDQIGDIGLMGRVAIRGGRDHHELRHFLAGGERAEDRLYLLFDASFFRRAIASVERKTEATGEDDEGDGVTDEIHQTRLGRPLREQGHSKHQSEKQPRPTIYESLRLDQAIACIRNQQNHGCTDNHHRPLIHR